MTRDWTPGVEDPAVSELAATPQLVVALDFDGTAAPFVLEPMTARALPEVAAAVARLAALPRTVVAYVSGRSLRDLRVIAEHDDDSPIALAGSHGAQYWFPGDGETIDEPDDEADAERVALIAAVRAVVDGFPGVRVEPKTYGVGVHTRGVDLDIEERAFAAVDAMAAARFPHVRRRQGDRVLEFATRMEGKDAAIAVLRRRFAATAVLFAGDDVTDEDALRALHPGDLGVRVGSGPTSARLRVESPEQIAGLLSALADERRAARE